MSEPLEITVYEDGVAINGFIPCGQLDFNCDYDTRPVEYGGSLINQIRGYDYTMTVKLPGDFSYTIREVNSKHSPPRPNEEEALW